MLIGYARVSTSDQETSLQVDALKRFGVRRVFWEKGSGVGPRPELQRVLRLLKRGDVLVVWKLDRIARSLQDLLRVMELLQEKGCSFRSLTEPVDTTTSMGRLVLQILGAVAEFERSLIRERSMAGQIAALQRGVTWGGRPPLLGPEDRNEVRRCYLSGWWTLEQLAAAFGVSRTTIQRVLGIVPMSYPRGRLPVLGSMLEAHAE
ncbi:recombinase family protein [Variovorax sp. tm]|uniref:recombinase family protein n=1 Tax=Variovorax atrisoli TaxID=3394203 RepID=UPI003A80371C